MTFFENHNCCLSSQLLRAWLSTNGYRKIKLTVWGIWSNRSISALRVCSGFVKVINSVRIEFDSSKQVLIYQLSSNDSKSLIDDTKRQTGGELLQITSYFLQSLLQSMKYNYKSVINAPTRVPRLALASLWTKSWSSKPVIKSDVPNMSISTVMASEKYTNASHNVIMTPGQTSNDLMQIASYSSDFRNWDASTWLRAICTYMCIVFRVGINDFKSNHVKPSHCRIV